MRPCLTSKRIILALCFALQLQEIYSFLSVRSAFPVVEQSVPRQSQQNKKCVAQGKSFRRLVSFRDFPRSSATASTKTVQHLAVDPTVVGSAVFHVIAGSAATPFVIKAVKTWYRRIPLPSWTPPDNIFAPVWTVLYACLGIAAARVASLAKGGWKSTPILLWAVHLALNLSWAPLFFGLAKLRTGLIVNVLMLATMPFVLKSYAAVDPTSAVLLLPYLGWLTFATFLNQAICKLNPMDGKGYSNAMLQADIVKLQKDAAKKVGL
jgi:tryptophan-rich sensory protein